MTHRSAETAARPRGAPAIRPLKILVVDDEPAMVGALGALLGQAGHRIIAAYDGEEALRRFREDAPDLVLLDLAMPGMDGATVCRRIRDDERHARSSSSPASATGPRPSSCSTSAPTTTCASPSAPTSCSRGSARSRARERPRAPSRHGAATRPATSWTGRRHEIRWQGTPLPVTVTEFRLLRAMVERLGEVVRHDELLAAGWPDVPDPDPLWLKPHLARLREKLVSVGAPVPVAVRGVGYRLDA